MRFSSPRLLLVFAGALFAFAAPVAQTPSVLFRNITAESGVTFQHHFATEKRYIVESMSGGVAMFDFDNDGLPDLYFIDSLTVDTRNDAKAARSGLYKNLGGGKFLDVTDKAGVGHPGWSVGVCTADVDGDGWEDIFVTAIGRNYYYHNNHDGTFTDLTEKAGLLGGGYSTGCGFADYDRDGKLDLFVSRYVHVDLDNLPQFGKDKTCEYRGVPVQCGPRGMPGEGDFLYHNDGDGHFTEVGAKAGVSDPREYFGLGIAWFDYNDDGWPDLYVANDSQGNFLYENQKNGTFKEIGFPAGVAVSEDGSEQGSMGVAVVDYDHSGRFSLFVTNFSEEYNALYHNDGDHFTDVSFRSKIAPPSLPFVCWGDTFLDYDNDTWPDVMVVAGHVYPQMDRARLGLSAGYRERKLLHHNRGNGTFDEVGAQYGPVFTEEGVGRGTAVGDFDNDGRIDAVVNQLDGAPEVLHNEFPNPGHWLIVKLKGGGLNTGAIGAVVIARSGGVNQMRLVQSGTGYISQDDKRLHFGLGAATSVDSLEVKWPDGSTSKLENVKADQVLTIEEGKS